jgi:hypothetical protein
VRAILPLSLQVLTKHTVCDAGHRFNGKTCAVGTSSCKKSHCTGPIPVHSHHTCKAGACSFFSSRLTLMSCVGCNAGYHPEAGACIVDKTTCSSSADCARSHPKHSHVFCNKGTCGIRTDESPRRSAIAYELGPQVAMLDSC